MMTVAELTVNVRASAPPPNVTAVALVKLVPEITTCEPGVPNVEVNAVIVGGEISVKLPAVWAMPPPATT